MTNTKLPLRVLLVGLASVPTLLLAACGGVPRTSLRCDIESETSTRVGTENYYVLDGHKAKYFGGYRAEKGKEPYVYIPENAKDNSSGWESTSVNGDVVFWAFDNGETRVENEFDLAKKTLVRRFFENKKQSEPDRHFKCHEVLKDSDGIVEHLEESQAALASRLASQKAKASREKAIADGSYKPEEFEVGGPCKALAEANTLTKKVDWGFFGGANSKWFPAFKTIILSGKTQNAFGVEIPFTVECRWEKGGSVRIVEMTN